MGEVGRSPLVDDQTIRQMLDIAQRGKQVVAELREEWNRGFDRFATYWGERIREATKALSKLSEEQQRLTVDQMAAAIQTFFGPYVADTFRKLLHEMLEAAKAPQEAAADYSVDALNLVLFPMWRTIREVANRLWEMGGQQPGMQLQNWLDAQQTLLNTLRASKPDIAHN